jgi:hypothetical protein
MTSKLMPEFRGFIQDNTDPSDANMFFRRLGVQIEPLAETVGSQRKGSAQTHPMPGNNEDFSESFKARPAIKKWRSAEQNAAEYLRSLRTILSVADVSQANLGYDLEILLTNGKRAYVEVKSVAHFSEPFKISNNEYASAHRYGEDYHIALVVNEDPFLIQFITNPINILGFEKKCERWSWYCEDYSTVLKHVSQTLT